MSFQQCTRFRTTVHFDRKLWNGSSNRQLENGVMNYNFFPHSVKTIWWNEKNDRDIWLMALNMFMQKISSSWMQRFMNYRVHKLFLPYLATVKNSNIRSC